MTVVLDASAVLALLRGEPGAEIVGDHLRSDEPTLISAVNYSEAVQKLAQLGSTTAAEDVGALISLGLTVAAFDAELAVATAALWPATRGAGLSLGDRACLALAAAVPGARALTSDQPWSRVDVGVPIDLIR
ncbi:PIN domain nuclease [Amycolatopsis antarctica]|uniref:PIN domain nuclease n=1 Tax=Amycolatopsis antarctica TaxID=1854586 RepID=A0A263D0U3_9PSEU|nr:type II toxin-antitoxin system VapC family toxin [Amycolatopsis antarctica]OZM71257.1 PIN domain nuclease [Amycolatopsis antarctica]